MRVLAGGSYLDIGFGYEISHNHVFTYFYQCLKAIDRVLNNICFPLDDEVKLRELEQGFLNISKGVFPGTVAAGDGVVFKMRKPSHIEVDGDVHSFFTRKGYYAYGMQAFVDSSCRFLNISMQVCSSTHDSTAYILSDLSKAIRDGRLPSWAHIVLDEAYVNTTQELSPYKGKNLGLYEDSFNYHLSLHRQVVERAFGLLVGRWGIFWRPLCVSFHKIPLIIRVACKLHNLCVDRFGHAVPLVMQRDIRPNDVANPFFTDGTTGLYRGRRTDLEESNTRLSLTNRLRELQISRPSTHTSYKRSTNRI